MVKKDRSLGVCDENHGSLSPRLDGTGTGTGT